MIVYVLGIVLLLGSAPSCQGLQKKTTAEVIAFQLDATTGHRFVDIGETDYRDALRQLERRKKQLAAARDLVGGQKLEAQENYLHLLHSRQAGRIKLRKKLERLEWELSEASRYGKTDVVQELSTEIDRERSQLEAMKRVPVKELASTMKEGYGLFFLDLAALEARELETLATRLDERAEAYRSRASLARSKISNQGPHKGRNQQKVLDNLDLLQADEHFADQMAVDLTELGRLIRAEQIDQTQSLADRKWAETCGV